MKAKKVGALLLTFSAVMSMAACGSSSSKASSSVSNSFPASSSITSTVNSSVSSPNSQVAQDEEFKGDSPEMESFFKQQHTPFIFSSIKWVKTSADYWGKRSQNVYIQLKLDSENCDPQNMASSFTNMIESFCKSCNGKFKYDCASIDLYNNKGQLFGGVSLTYESGKFLSDNFAPFMTNNVDSVPADCEKYVSALDNVYNKKYGNEITNGDTSSESSPSSQLHTISSGKFYDALHKMNETWASGTDFNGTGASVMKDDSGKYVVAFVPSTKASAANDYNQIAAQFIALSYLIYSNYSQYPELNNGVRIVIGSHSEIYMNLDKDSSGKISPQLQRGDSDEPLNEAILKAYNTKF